MTIKAGVLMVSPDTSKVLIVINKNTMGPKNLKFGLPKGHIEDKESIIKCAARELREETGIHVHLKDTDNTLNTTDTTYYLIKASKCTIPKPMDNTEIGASKWVTWKKIMKTDCNRGLRMIREKIKNKKNTLFNLLKSLPLRKIKLAHLKPPYKQIHSHAKKLEHDHSTSTRITGSTSLPTKSSSFTSKSAPYISSTIPGKTTTDWDESDLP